MDIVDKQTRSRMMAGIKSSDTAPEMLVRRYLHAAGLRFTLHNKKLPGRPDLVFPKHRVVIFVNGCFWHRHLGCSLATMPSTNTEFWAGKFAATVTRDKNKSEQLKQLGWNVLMVWECELGDADSLDHLFWNILAAVAG